MHLEAGERLADSLKLTGKVRKEFLVGCLLPDVNNGYTNNPKVVKEHHETHYVMNEKSSLNFYAENREKIEKKVPIFMGYLFHLFTDGFFNYDFFRRVKRSSKYKNLSHEEKTELKHHDFWLYEAKYYHYLGIKDINEAKELAKKANAVPAVEVTGEDLLEVDEIMRSRALLIDPKGEGFLFYTEEYLDGLFDLLISEFREQYLSGKKPGAKWGENLVAEGD